MWPKFLTVLLALEYFDRCPRDLKFQTVNYKQLDGRWYEHSRYRSFFPVNRCTSVDVESTHDDYFAYRVNVTNVDASGNKDYVVKNEEMEYSILNRNDSMWNKFPNALKDDISCYNHGILSTDYKNYVIFYACYENYWLSLFSKVPPVFHFKLVWILTRERVPSNETLKVVHNILEENNLSLDPLIEIDQSNCY